MPLSRSFKETVKERLDEDPAFRDALLAEGVDALLSGEVDVGKVILRDYINATLGFAKLADETGIPVKSLMRMFGPAGNPSARNLFSVIHVLQQSSGASLTVGTAPQPSRSRVQRSRPHLRKTG
jgi:DNA-binding phage protein